VRNNDKKDKIPTVEQLCRLIKSSNYAYAINRIEKRLKSGDEVGRLEKRISYAKARTIEPLSLSEKFTFICFPFGITSQFSPDISYRHYKEYGYFKKHRQYLMFSVLGVALYINIFYIIINLANKFLN
jgi:hypothetical protein